MKSYPSIEYWNKGLFDNQVYAFDKIDGSNIRCEWSKKRGWYKFGTRKQIIDEKHEQFGEAVSIFMEEYAQGLENVFKEDRDLRNAMSFVVFCEFFGENSFAGDHKDEDEKYLVLFDVNQYKKGFIPPKEFINKFKHLGTPRVVYSGSYTKVLVSRVKENEFNLKEGVVVKGIRRTKKGADNIWMVKIKTNDWLKKLKETKGEKEFMKELNNDLSLI